MQTLCYFMLNSDLPNGDKIISVWDNTVFVFRMIFFSFNVYQFCWNLIFSNNERIPSFLMHSHKCEIAYNWTLCENLSFTYNWTLCENLSFNHISSIGLQVVINNLALERSTAFGFETRTLSYGLGCISASYQTLLLIFCLFVLQHIFYFLLLLLLFFSFFFLFLFLHFIWLFSFSCHYFFVSSDSLRSITFIHWM